MKCARDGSAGNACCRGHRAGDDDIQADELDDDGEEGDVGDGDDDDEGDGDGDEERTRDHGSGTGVIGKPRGLTRIGSVLICECPSRPPLFTLPVIHLKLLRDHGAQYSLAEMEEDPPHQFVHATLADYDREHL